jgi:hypothetical protein
LPSLNDSLRAYQWMRLTSSSILAISSKPAVATCGCLIFSRQYLWLAGLLGIVVVSRGGQSLRWQSRGLLREPFPSTLCPINISTLRPLSPTTSPQALEILYFSTFSSHFTFLTKTSHSLNTHQSYLSQTENMPGIRKPHSNLTHSLSRACANRGLTAQHLMQSRSSKARSKELGTRDSRPRRSQ